MFVGAYRHTIDPKGRVSVPRKFLDQLPESDEKRVLFATEGLDGCIFLFTEEQWNQVTNQVRGAPLGDEQARAFSRRFYGQTRDVEVDAGGRILLAKELRDAAGIRDEAWLVGVGTRIEIWSPERWEAHRAEHSSHYEEHAKGIFRA